MTIVKSQVWTLVRVGIQLIWVYLDKFGMNVREKNIPESSATAVASTATSKSGKASVDSDKVWGFGDLVSAEEDIWVFVFCN